MMMRLITLAAVLTALLMLGPPALASDHMDFHRQQCNSGTAALAAQVRGCSKIAGSDRFEADAKGIAYYNMGVAYGLNGQFNKAVENYTKALKLNPRDAEAARNRALALQVLKEPGKKPGGQPGGQPNGKKEITRTDLPEDMRRSTSSRKVKQKKQVQKARKKRTIKKQTKAKRTKAERKKVE